MAGTGKRIILAAALILMASQVFAADSGLLGGAFADNGIAARPIGLAGAFTAVADDANASWWNPAGMALLGKERSMSFTYVPQLFSDVPDLSDLYIGYAQGDTMGFGALGGSVRYLSAKIAPDYTGDDSFKWAEYIIALSWAMQVDRYIGLSKYTFPKVAIGFNLKYFGSSTDLKLNGTDVSGNGFGGDAALMVAIKENLRVGIMAKNILSQVTWQTGTKESLPYELNAGVYYSITTELMIAFDLKTTENSANMPDISGYCAGAEYNWAFGKNAQIQTLAIRGGAQYLPVTDSIVAAAGASIAMETFAVDYAFQYYIKSQINQSTHRFGLTVYF